MRGERRDGQYTVTGTPDVAVSQQNLTATVILEPGEKRTYESVFESEVWYDIRFTLDDKYRERTPQEPFSSQFVQMPKLLVGH